MTIQETFSRALELGAAGTPSTVPLSSMVRLVSEYFQYAQRTCKTVEDIEGKMARLGREAGRPLWTYVRMLERARTKSQDTTYRFVNLEATLHHIKDTAWPVLFGKPAASIQRPATESLEYYLVDEWPVLEHFTSYPPNYGGALPSVFVVGLLGCSI